MLTRTEKFKEYRDSIKEDDSERIIETNENETAPTYEVEMEQLRKINKQKYLVTFIYIGLILLIALGLIISGVIIF